MSLRKAMVSATKRKPVHATVADDERNDRHGTPREFFDWRDSECSFTVDVCADSRNHKLPLYFDEARNGLAQSWADQTFWCNPPYGDQLPAWVSKAREESCFGNAAGELLLPMRPDTKWWRNLVLGRDGEAGKLRSSRFVPETLVWWLRFDLMTVYWYVHDQRLTFEGEEDSAPFPSVLVGMVGRNRRLTAGSGFAGRKRDYPNLFDGQLR